MTRQTELTASTRRVVATLALVAVLVVGALPAAGAVGGLAGAGGGASVAATDDVAADAGAAAVAATAGGAGLAQVRNNSTVDVTVGSQLSTVVSVTSETVRTDIEETEFELEYETGEGERSELLAERAETLSERANDLREDYRKATRAYERGNITRTEYARRLAAMNARADALLDSYERLRNRSANVSGVDLAAAGLNATAVERTVDGLDNLTGPGLSALLARFVAERDGEVSVETAGGVEVTVESEDGERTREFERPGDGSRNITVPQATALETARTALSDRDGRWVLHKTSVHEYEGTYRFEFGLLANDTTGESEVTVDGSSGAVVELESEVEPRDGDDEEDDGADEGGEDETDDDDDDEADDDDDDEDDDDEFENETDEDGGRYDELALVVVSGTPAPNATVTLQALADGAPVPDATVRANDAVVSTTGADGMATLTLPDEDSVELEVEAGDAEGELEFEFEDDEGVYGRLRTEATYADGRVHLTVTYEGTGVADATVTANGDVVGATGADGTVAFPANDSATLEIRVTKGQFAAAVTYEVVDGSTRLVEPIHRSEDDDDDDDGDEDDGDGDDDDDGDDRDEDDGTEGGDDDDDGDDDDGVEYDVLVIDLVSGDPAPGATVTVQVLGDGAPVSDATVLANDAPAATTGADGTATLTLPDEDSVELEVEAGNEEGELRFDFDDETETPTEDDETETSTADG